MGRSNLWEEKKRLFVSAISQTRKGAKRGGTQGRRQRVIWKQTKETKKEDQLGRSGPSSRRGGLESGMKVTELEKKSNLMGEHPSDSESAKMPF